MRTATDAPRMRQTGSRRRRLAPNTPTPDPRMLAARPAPADDDATARVHLIEFDWEGDHGTQAVILRRKRLLD
jgi:hypothetical protein